MSVVDGRTNCCLNVLTLGPLAFASAFPTCSYCTTNSVVPCSIPPPDEPIPEVPLPPGASVFSGDSPAQPGR